MHLLIMRCPGKNPGPENFFLETGEKGDCQKTKGALLLSGSKGDDGRVSACSTSSAKKSGGIFTLEIAKCVRHVLHAGLGLHHIVFKLLFLPSGTITSTLRSDEGFCYEFRRNDSFDVHGLGSLRWL